MTVDHGNLRRIINIYSVAHYSGSEWQRQKKKDPLWPDISYPSEEA